MFSVNTKRNRRKNFLPSTVRSPSAAKRSSSAPKSFGIIPLLPSAKISTTPFIATSRSTVAPNVYPSTISTSKYSHLNNHLTSTFLPLTHREKHDNLRRESTTEQAVKSVEQQTDSAQATRLISTGSLLTPTSTLKYDHTHSMKFTLGVKTYQTEQPAGPNQAVGRIVVKPTVGRQTKIIAVFATSTKNPEESQLDLLNVTTANVGTDHASFNPYVLLYLDILVHSCG